MQLAQRHIIKSTEHRFVEIDKLAFQSQNLYNAAIAILYELWKGIKSFQVRKIEKIIFSKQLK